MHAIDLSAALTPAPPKKVNETLKNTFKLSETF